MALCILMASAVVACSGSDGGRETVDTSGPSEDATTPSVVGTSPEKGATSVAPDAGFLVTFSEPMDTAGIETAFSITPATDGAINWFADNSVMVFTPTDNWDYETRFTVAISAAARDTSGNALGSSYQFSFTTAPDIIPPIIIGTSPIDGATPVEIGTAISVAFSEAMNRDTTESAISISPAAKGIFNWSADDSVLTFIPSVNWNYDITYTVTLDVNATDRAANPLGSQRQFSFTTVPDATPPAVISTFPIDGATSAELTVAVSVTFSETMEHDLTESAVSITPAVYGTFAWSARGSVLTFTTPANLGA